MIVLGSESESSKHAKTQQDNPEKALKHYFSTAYRYIHNEGVTFSDVKQTVTADDWQWYEDNYQNMKADPFDVSGGIDPNSADVLARSTALISILQSGPCRRDTKILSSEIYDSEATFHVEYLADTDLWVETDVTVVKEDGRWKVKDFAGGRLTAGSSF